MPQPANAPTWWRRNRWGLAALVPILVAAFYLPAQSLYEDYTGQTALRAAAIGSGGWANYNGARVRLVELAPLVELRRSNGEVYVPGPNIRAWQATLAFEAAEPTKMVGACELWLEDVDGRRYKAGPIELIPAKLPSAASIPNCVPTRLDDRPVPTKYQIQVYFVMPANAYPAAVRITLIGVLPDYVRLPAY